MQIFTKLKKTTKFIVLSEDKTYFLGNKLVEINVGLNKLKTDILEPFLNSERLGEKLKTVYDKNAKTKFSDKHYFEEGDGIIFYDLFILCIYYKLGLLAKFKDKKIGFIYNKKIYFNNNFDYLFYFSSQILGSIYVDTLKEIKGKCEIWVKENKFLFPFSWRGKGLGIGELTLSLNDRVLNDLNFFNVSTNKKKVKIKTGLFDPVLVIKKLNKSSVGFAYSANYTLSNKKDFNIKDNILNSTGFDYKNKNLAKLKCFVEAIERFNSSIFVSDLKEKKKLKDYDLGLIEKIIGFKIDEKYYNSLYFSKKIYEVEPFLEDLKIINTKLSLPIDIICYPNNITINKNYFYKANSSGIGAGNSYEDAFLSGLLELSERDSIILTRIHKLTPNIIFNLSLPNLLKEKVEFLELNSLGKLYIFDISYDKSYCHILTILRYGYNKFTLGASCSFDLQYTINKALDELSVSYLYDKRKTKIIKKYSEVNEVSDHMDFYLNNGNIKYIDFLFKNNKTVNYNDLFNLNHKNLSLGEKFSLIKDQIGGKFYISDLTTNYSKNLGIYVLRVISENFIPIWFGYNQKGNLPVNKKRYFNKNEFVRWQLDANNYNIPNFLHFFD